KQISEHAGNDATLSTGWVVLAVGLFLALVGALSLRHWWRTRRERPTPVLTFMALARQLGLSLSDQWLLIRLSMRQKLPTPITLVLSPGTLRHHARAAAARLGHRRSAKLMRR